MGKIHKSQCMANDFEVFLFCWEKKFVKVNVWQTILKCFYGNLVIFITEEVGHALSATQTNYTKVRFI